MVSGGVLTKAQRRYNAKKGARRNPWSMIVGQIAKARHITPGQVLSRHLVEAQRAYDAWKRGDGNQWMTQKKLLNICKARMGSVRMPDGHTIGSDYHGDYEAKMPDDFQYGTPYAGPIRAYKPYGTGYGLMY